MIICSRCNLEQDESPQCEYCGLDFSEQGVSVPTSKAPNAKWIVIFALMLAICVASVASYWIISSPTKPVQKSSIVKGSSGSVQATTDKDLRTTAKELTGDVGIVGELTGGSTRGSVIAMVVFSIIGLGYLSYGKKSQQLLMVICGIGLMGYSYFIDGTLYIILVGLALSTLPFVLSRK
jgi:hypothetical protein